jgi:PAS domain S-box-containing protein
MSTALSHHLAVVSQLFKDSDSCAAVMDSKGEVVYCNDRLLALGGWSSVFAAGPALADAFANTLAEAATAHKVELPLSNRDGRRWRVRWLVTRLAGPQGEWLGHACIGTLLDDGVLWSRRQADFYRALVDTNQAIAACRTPAELCGAICRIVVDSGHAVMAWIGMLEGQELVPIAWGGGAAAYTSGLSLHCSGPLAESSPGPSIWAMRTGVPQVCNDFHSDVRTRPWRERATAFRIRASGAFPFRRGGAVAGTLNIYFDEVGAFDAPLIELLEEMTVDLGLGLDNIDRETGRLQAERALGEREQQLSDIIDTAMDGIISVDAQHQVVVFNRAAERIFGLPRHEAIGQGIDRFIPADRRAAHRTHMVHFATPGFGSRVMGRPRALMGLRADGSAFPMEASISRVGAGSDLLMTVMVRDVTQLRAAEQAELARAAAEAANRAKTDFLSRISHELRTPLNAVLGIAQLMQTDRAEPLAPKHRRQIGMVLQAGSHLHTLIDEMLDVARIEAGEMVVEASDFELGELLDGVMRMSEPSAMAAGVQLIAEYAGAVPLAMHSDPARLRQILLNLLSNAIKYNLRGHWVRVRLRRESGHVHIEVEDNGMGMSQEQQSSLFQPFNRLGRERGPVQGMGIGLVLVRQLVRLLDGELTLSSREAHGTTAHVVLPIGQGPAAAVASVEPAVDDQAELHGVVLYIEDNPVNVIVIQDLLARWPGVQLVVASDGHSGIQLARTLRPDLVLLDMQLPDISGLEVLRRLRAEPATAGLTVVALSASAVAHEVQAARDAGAVEYWSKPIDFERFLAGLHRLLARGHEGPDRLPH